MLPCCSRRAAAATAVHADHTAHQSILFVLRRSLIRVSRISVIAAWICSMEPVRSSSHSTTCTAGQACNRQQGMQWIVVPLHHLHGRTAVLPSIRYTHALWLWLTPATAEGDRLVAACLTTSDDPGSQKAAVEQGLTSTPSTWSHTSGGCAPSSSWTYCWKRGHRMRRRTCRVRMIFSTYTRRARGTTRSRAPLHRPSSVA